MSNIFSWDHKGGKGPWGKPTSKPTTGAGRKPSTPKKNSPQPSGAEVEEILKNIQANFQKVAGNGPNGGGAGFGGTKLLSLAVLAAFILWLLSGFYIVSPDEQGVVTRFGRYVQTTNPGLNYHLPAPIEMVQKPKVTRENIVEVGFRSPQTLQQTFGAQIYRNFGNSDVQKVPEESLMLTGDENIVDLSFTVRWKIADPKDYLFNVVDPNGTIKAVAESSMREVIGLHPIDDALTGNKNQIQQEARALMQEILNSYNIGVEVVSVQLQQVNPPQQVISAFRDVQAARADAEKAQNQATGYANDILPRARGEAAQILQEAQGYRAAKIAEAEGAAARFKSQLAEYSKAKSVTSQRLYIETMEDVLKDAQKVIISGEAASGVVPYLPLNELRKGK